MNLFKSYLIHPFIINKYLMRLYYDLILMVISGNLKT